MTVASEPKCPMCGAVLMGRWCHACGQDTTVRPHPLREMMSEAVEAVTSFDNKAVRTFGAMVVRPASILVSYRGGASARYITPLKLFLIATTLFLATLSLSGVAFYQYVYRVENPAASLAVSVSEPDLWNGETVMVAGTVEEERWLRPRDEIGLDPKVTEALRGASTDSRFDARERAAIVFNMGLHDGMRRTGEVLAAWLPHILWALMPIHALLLSPFFGLRRLLAEHLAFAMWAHATLFVVLTLVVLGNAAGLRLPDYTPLPFYLAYMVVVARRYYAQSWFAACWKCLVHTLIYTFLILAPAAVLVMLAVMDRSSFTAYWSAM